jgi:hypothetical protein
MTGSEEQMKPISVVRSAGAAGLAMTAAIGLYAAPAFGAVQASGSIAPGTPFDIGPAPNGLPSSCTFTNGDANFVFSSGSFVAHDTSNANGDWTGFTAQGTAEFLEDSTQVGQGHLTVWEGGGNNAKGQNEGGLTVNFTGTVSGGTVQIHVNGQMTTNAQGQPTADILNVGISCS